MPIADMLLEYRQFFLAFHLLGVVIGLGGATIADTLFFRFLKDLRITRREAEVLHWISLVVTASLLLVFLSGGGIFLGDPLRYGASPAFIFKMLAVSILTVNGLLLHAYVSPRLVHISFHPPALAGPVNVPRLRRIAFAMGAVSATSWYSVFFISMLKGMLPATVTLPMLLAAYAFLLLIAIVSAVSIEGVLGRRGRGSA